MRLINRLSVTVTTLFACCLTSCGQYGFRTVDADEFEKAILADTVQLVDVRTADEFKTARIGLGTAKNIDMKRTDFMEQAARELDKCKTVAVYCRSGRRSAEAAGQLAEAGFKVIDLKGGILEWQARGKTTK